MTPDELIAEATREERKALTTQACARRRTRRRPKPLTPVKDWTAYPHEFVPLKALSLRWGEAEQTIRKWIRHGALRGFKFGGGLWKVKAEDARVFEERAEVKIAV